MKILLFVCILTKLCYSGGYDERLKENVEYLEELRSLAEKEGVSDRVNFITSCSTAERNELLSSCLCVLYTPTVKVTILFFFCLSPSFQSHLISLSISIARMNILVLFH
jgi:glycosyltransferase involved in cell wall biosynthesis